MRHALFLVTSCFTGPIEKKIIMILTKLLTTKPICDLALYVSRRIMSLFLNKCNNESV